MMDIANYLKSQSQLVEQQLDQLIPVSHGPYQHLFEAARYALLGSGKRLRPILTLATNQMLGGSSSAALIPACTLELIHTYSMIHDDLPCMDDDDYRRGKLTVHRKYSEGHAVLTGDFLLTYAFEVLSTAPHLTPEKKIKLISTLARQSGGEGMIGGQVMDLSFEGKKISLDSLRLLHRNKTAALLTAAVEFGGIIADATDAQLNCLRHFGENIGLAFQVIDDILDVTSSQTKHGRSIASDVLNEKSTYVSLMGLEQAQACALNFYQQALQALKPLPFDTSLLINISDFILKRQH
ncbi:polyprenyl synthetase family protein [Candidatus Protochlamydia phocaeensis]|uniref:polyprenyl synthetase family protein n=1 Tax=Candidatus Protochlamydia phocaeensis TaxID=1414722 RepID=UPI00083806DD|nr:farnesyl diphosphate synthase [Candidatus Protochlamydia phocaeensis]